MAVPEGMKIASVSCGGYHTLALTTEGVALACGKNEYGRLGLGAGQPNQHQRTLHPVLPIYLPPPHAPPDAPSQRLGEPVVDPVMETACGGSHSMIRTGSGRVFTFGRASLGRLGNGSTEDESQPTPVLVESLALSGRTAAQVECGGQHSFVVLAD